MSVRQAQTSGSPRQSRIGKALAAGVVVAAAVTGINVATPSAASAAWEDCGDYVCTTYLTRDETKAVAQYLNNVTPYSTGAANAYCAFIGSKAGWIGGVGAVGCVELANRYDWRPAANEAVDHDACFQVAYRKDWWGKIFPTTGWTNHSGYCK